MNKYFINTTGTGASLAVEKHLSTYFRKYECCVVSEDYLPRLAGEVEAEQNRYFETHRGQRVEVRTYASGVTGDVFFSFGSVSYCFRKINAIYE